MSFPKYEHYKDSGVEWLGEVPAHWSVTPFKWQIAKNDGGVWGDDPDGTDDTFVLRSTEQTVDGRWKLDDPALRKLSKGEKEACVLAVGDLVVTKSSGSSLHIGKTTIVTLDIAEIGCCYSNFMQRIRVASSFDARLAWYIMNNEVARLQFDLASNSTTGLANLNGTMIGQILVTVPPHSEQAGITNFLDRETTKLDILITEQRTLIDLLKEKRQAVISHAVTKGLDPRVPMKDSGVEWLGEVPAHWNMLALKRISPSQTVGIVVNPSEYVSSEGLPFIYGGDISEGFISHAGARRISLENSERNKKTKLNAGDVLVVRVGAPGVAAVVPPECEGGNCASVMLVRKGDFCSDWLCFLLNSRVVRYQVEVVQYGAAQEQFNIAHAVEFVLPTPDLNEQKNISAYLGREATKIDALTAEAQTTIALLQERRSALISAAVTGKIDVRQAA